MVVMMSDGPASNQPLSGNSIPLSATPQVINLFKDDVEQQTA